MTMVKFMKLAGFLYMLLIMILYFTFFDIIHEFERALGKTSASIILIVITLTGFLSLMSLMKRRSSGPISKDEQDSEQIDFSKNSPTVPRDQAREVKPIDLTGNVFHHNDETLKEDLSFLDYPTKKDDDQK